MKKLMMLEFNELCPSLVKRFMDAGHLPNFKRLHDSSVIRTTDANANGEDLNPWVQWVDVHTGLDFKDHGLQHLNEAHKFDGKFTWDILSEKFGVKSWICGSMNGDYSDSFKGRFLPDPWAAEIRPNPPQQMDDYYNFICQGVQGHSGNSAEVSTGTFIRSLLKNGVSISTVMKLAHQMMKEKLLGKGSWERAMILDWIQFDVFKHYYKKESPQFSTFFSNSCAHYQHHYWRDFEPEVFGDDDYEPDTEKSQAILNAYKNTDSIAGKILDMIDDDTAVLFATALSQQPYTESERFYYHISGETEFRQQFNIPSTVTYTPVMATQFHLHCSSEAEAAEVEAQLTAYEMDSDEYFHVGNKTLFLVFRKDNNMLDVQCRVTKDARPDATFVDTRDGSTHKLYDHFYQMNDTKTGMHNPYGLYWFRHPQKSPELVEETCPPSQVHHDVINFFGAAA